MTGVLAALAGAGPAIVRDPTSGDYFDTSNRVTRYTYIGINPPFSSYYETVFRWGGTNVATVTNPYPESPVTSTVVGAYTYYVGDFESTSGSDPIVDLYGIYRVGPPA